ncbi:phospho-sugar mutase [Alicyclobacillus kakegawensis]|uniref:phospho-sugar mutase n=1 Tax=Alicyclobacillus kakegawensis TaxID=392012 RepID=UPI000832AE88|nr:phospho-sugar mutase [Alicyclobacillus kakegawensis]
MDVTTRYQQWLSYSGHSPDFRAQLEALAEQPDALYDAFYRDLEFGTGGLRGVLGPGTNRMNVYTVRRTTLGLARYVANRGEDAKTRGVAIGYDCRRMSREFALEVACVLAACGVRAHLFEHLCPTSELSFAVRRLQAAAGVMITASHNPPEYNGYKVYNEDGGQLLPDEAKLVMKEIEAVTDLFSIPRMDADEAQAAGLLTWIGEEMDKAYTGAVVDAVREPAVAAQAREQLRIVYTPLHGTGNLPVRQVLSQSGYKNVFVVAQQEAPDGEFSTTRSPNPEEPEALAMAIAEARRQQADLVMGTDPDADRVGIAVRGQDGEYHLLTGNQVGGLLVDFVLSQRQARGQLPDNGVVFKTIVTSGLGAAAARRYGIKSEDTLTGFKYIGDRVRHYEATGEKTFVFGYEESYGYLASPIVRDKDAVQACLLIAEMAAFHQMHGRTLLDALAALYGRVGHFQERLVSVTLPGADGLARILTVMRRLREQGLPEVDGLVLETVEDYQAGERRRADGSGGVEALTLPRSDVLRYLFAGGSWLAVRPSGTEPKLKLYLGAQAPNEEGCLTQIQRLNQLAEKITALAD